MIRAQFWCDGGSITGFSVKGHAGAGECGEDIVCAAVSSAAYMTANTLTEICGAKADITVNDGELSLSLTETDAFIQKVLEGFLLHMNGLQEQYPKRIQVLKTEV